MEEAAEFFEDDVDAQMKADLEKTKQKLNDKIPFEEKLVCLFCLIDLYHSINLTVQILCFQVNCSIITHIYRNMIY